ncbi:MAG: hypothetical protein ABI790_08825 [Betaproteobacteria bacterium]
MKNRPMLFACAFAALAGAFNAAAQTPATPPGPPVPAAAPSPATAPNPATPAADAPPAPPAIVYKEGVIKVGTEMKQTLGQVTDVEKGDNGCYLTLKNEKGVEFIEVGKFEICGQKPPLKGKKVALAFNLETIQATSCYGDPKCKKTETVPLVIGVKIVE